MLSYQLIPFPEKTSHLILLSVGYSLILDACPGDDLITPDSKEPFDRVDENFVKWGANEITADTPEAAVDVCAMSQNGNFQNLFGSFGIGLDKLCFTHGQIKNFNRKFRHWLRTDGYGTFFLFKARGKYFVSSVGLLDSSNLGVALFKFKSRTIWEKISSHRLVVPKWTL